MRALPHTYRGLKAEEGTVLVFKIEGPAGGGWSLWRAPAQWVLYHGVDEGAAAMVQLDQETAWRLFTKGMVPEEARNRVTIKGDRNMGSKILDMVSLMA